MSSWSWRRGPCRTGSHLSGAGGQGEEQGSRRRTQRMADDYQRRAGELKTGRPLSAASTEKTSTRPVGHCPTLCTVINPSIVVRHWRHGHRNCSAPPSGQAPKPLSRRAAGAGLDGESADRAIVMPPQCVSSDTVREIEYQILHLGTSNNGRF